MATKDIACTILEIAACALLLYGVWHREDLIRFERRVFMIAKVLWRSRKATRVASTARAGQITLVKPNTQNRGSHGNVRNSRCGSHTERNGLKWQK